MTVRHPYFSRKLATPITPKIETGTNQRTLQGCALFMGKVHHKRHTRPHSYYTARLILVAARTGRGAVERALGYDGWL
jgi:hypothetical protein